MGKNKLKKFREMEEMDIVLQYPFSVLQAGEFPLRGKWNDSFFHNTRPIVVELGCGKGEYTVELARRNSEVNYIGIDIKGARMWSGARQAVAEKLQNVAFVRTSIELIDRIFAPGEVSGLWITFPDPQMKKERKRLTGTRFMELYRKILTPGGIVNLKTDSPFLYTYTTAMLAANGIVPVTADSDIYRNGPREGEILGIRTYYEQQWLQRGLTIKYVSFRLGPEPSPLTEPDVEIEHDTYRSFSRGTLEKEGLRT